jgi:acetyl esterase/lipase
MPFGYLTSIIVMATYTLLAVRPPRPRRSSPFRLSFWLAFLINELPFVAFYILVASTVLAILQSGTDSPVFWAAFGIAVLVAAGLVLIAWRALLAKPALDRALREGLGVDWREHVEAAMAPRFRRSLPFARILIAPFFRRHDVERISNIRYGNEGSANFLDVYRHRSRPAGGPTFVHMHGGAFVMGKKSREARALLYRLASQGWVCISANYRLRGAGAFPNSLIDVKHVLAWVREHGRGYGADPVEVFVAGSSAGAHLAAMAALTPNDRRFQPGFEHVDTSVTAVVCLYGYYGIDSDSALLSSFLAAGGAEAPPFFVAHGDRDTLVVVEDARRFTERLRATSSNAVVYAELPWGQHSFDLFRSIRFETVIDGVEAFAAWVRSRDRKPSGILEPAGPKGGERRLSGQLS